MIIRKDGVSIVLAKKKETNVLKKIWEELAYWRSLFGEGLQPCNLFIFTL